jgi:hypothetical protein
MPAQANSEAQRLEQLTILTDRLSEIIDAEIAVLKERRPRALAETQDEKTRLSKIYAGEIARITKDAGWIRNLPFEVRKRFKEATARFRELVARQETMLAATRHVSERMLREIANELSRANAPQRVYGRNAAYAGSHAAHFALNKTA